MCCLSQAVSHGNVVLFSLLGGNYIRARISQWASKLQVFRCSNYWWKETFSHSCPTKWAKKVSSQSALNVTHHISCRLHACHQIVAFVWACECYCEEICFIVWEGWLCVCEHACVLHSQTFEMGPLWLSNHLMYVISVP